MPKSEKQITHLKRLNSLPQARANGFKKGHKPWNSGTAVMVERQCGFCDTTFEVRESSLKREAHHPGLFCSKSCFYSHKRKFGIQAQIKELYEQGKTYQEIGNILNRHPAMIGSQVYRMKIADRYGDGRNHPASKKRIRHLLKEYHGIDGCELCGYSRTTELSHVIETKNGGGLFLDNCILLCPNCHHLFDYKLLNPSEIKKLKRITRLNGNLARRLE